MGTAGEKTRQKTCLLMASAISLQLARECKDEAQQVQYGSLYLIHTINRLLRKRLIFNEGQN